MSSDSTAIVSTGAVPFNNSNLPKLDGTNFQSWKDMIEMAAELRGLKEALSEDGVDHRKNLQAKLLLLETMDESHRTQVRSLSTAREMMKRLEQVYADKSASNKYRLLYSYYRYNKAAEDSVSIHIGKMTAMRSALADLEEKQSEALFQVALIGSLPQEYSNILELWEMAHPEVRTTSNLIGRLLKREEDLKKVSPEQVFAVVGKEKSRMTIAERKKVTECNNCGKRGHWARECFSRREKKGEGDEKDSAQKANVVLNLGNLDRTLKDKWVADSGATQHMCNNECWFIDLQYFTEPKFALVGNGESVEIKGVGTVEALSTIDGEEVKLTLSKVSFIPELATSLISVGAASKKGITTAFEGNECKMFFQKRVIIEGKLREHDLYVLNISTPIRKDKSLLMKATRTAVEWHRVLGHPGKEKLTKLMDDSELGIKATGDLEQCAECVAGKAKHVSHPASTQSLVKAVGDKVHIDTGYLSNKASKFNYYLLCKDEHSSFLFIYHLESKKGVHLALKKLINEFEYGSGMVIRCIMSDNGSEFVNRENEILFAREGIVHETSAAYVPQQNGRIEREMQSVNNTATTLLCQAGLNESLEIEALTTACFLRNRMPKHGSTITPFEVFTGRKPYLLNLVEFGSPCQVLNNGYHVEKLQPKTTNGYIVGFTNRRNTYRVFVPALKRTVITCDVILGPHYKHVEDNKVVPDLRERDTQVRVDDYNYQAETNRLEKPSQSQYGWDHFETAATSQGLDDPLTSTARRQVKKSDKEYIEPAKLDEFFDGFIQELNETQTSSIAPALTSHSESEKESHDVVGDSDSDAPPPLPPRLTRSRTSALISLQVDEPANYKSAMNGSNSKLWAKAIEDELRAHDENQTWSIVQKPDEKLRLSAKWVFAIKRDSSGNIDRFKARLVARGFEQIKGIDYEELYAPVARTESIRLILALATSTGMNILQFDVATAFLNGILEEEIYIEAPEGIIVAPSECLKLNKALYGLKQAPRVWHSRLHKALSSFGLTQTLSEPCLYRSKNSTLFLIIYVDDGLIVGEDESECIQLLDKLRAEFKVKQLAGDKFVGLEIKRTETGMYISQTQYARDIVKRFNLEKAEHALTPCIDIKRLENTEDMAPAIAPYREAIGALMYLANGTRPDIAFTTNLFASFSENPKEIHWTGVQQIIRYVNATSDYSLYYKSGNKELKAYSDADWAGRISNRYSTSGVLITYAGGPVVFAARKQASIALSSTEAEFIAASEVVRELIWIKQLFGELSIESAQPILYVDNLSTIAQIRSEETTRRRKHIELRYMFIKHHLREKLFSVEHISSEQQPADILTKTFSGPRLRQVIENTKIVKRTNKMAPVRGLQTWVILALCGLIQAQLDEKWGFQRVEPIIWVPTNYYVEQGVELYSVKYVHRDPCDILFTESKVDNGFDIKMGLKKKAYERIHQLCQHEVRHAWVPHFEKLSKCGADFEKSKQNAGRFKRFIFLFIIAAAVVISVISSIVATTVVLNQKIDTVNATLNEAKIQIWNVRNAFELQQSMNNASLYQIETLTNQSRSMMMELTDFALRTSDLAWDGSKINQAISGSVQTMIDLTDACKRGLVDTKALATFTNQADIASIRSETTRIVAVRRLPLEKGLDIQFTAPNTSIDTHVYKVQAFRVWENVTTEPRLLEYIGPTYLIHNYTANCTKGIDEPEIHATYETCSERNFGDPRLQLWQVSTKNTTILPQIKKTKTHSYIECLYGNITIGGTTFQCPPHVFRLPLLQTFVAGPFGHSVEFVVINSTSEIQPPRVKHLNYSIFDEDYNDQLKLISSIRALSARLNGKLNTQTSHQPLSELLHRLTSEEGYHNLVSVLSIVSGLITISWCLWTSCGKRSPSGASQNEYVKVINNVQPQEHINESERIELTEQSRLYPYANDPSCPSHYETPQFKEV